MLISENAKLTGSYQSPAVICTSVKWFMYDKVWFSWSTTLSIIVPNLTIKIKLSVKVEGWINIGGGGGGSGGGDSKFRIQ